MTGAAENKPAPMTREEWIRIQLERAPHATPEQWRETLTILAGVPRPKKRKTPRDGEREQTDADGWVGGETKPPPAGST